MVGRGAPGSAPPGSALLLSLGFRPTYLPPDRFWRLPAVISLAMADAAEEVAGLASGTSRLKWPNDLVAAGRAERDVRKLAGVLGESDGIGSDDPRVVVGIGVNGDWPARLVPDRARGDDDLAARAGRRPIDHGALLDGFLRRLEPAIVALRRRRVRRRRLGASDRSRPGATSSSSAPDGAGSAVRAVGVDSIDRRAAGRGSRRAGRAARGRRRRDPPRPARAEPTQVGV